MSKHFPSRHCSALLLLALLGLPLVLAGCGGGGSNSTPNGGSSGNSSPAPTAAPVSVSAVTPSGLTATLAEDRATVPVGGSVTYTLALTNNTSQPITFVPTLDSGTPTVAAVSGTLLIVSPSGATVYPTPRTVTGPSFGLIGPATTLAPGQSASGALGPIGVFAAPGAYAATARFGFDSPVASPATVGPLTVTVQ